MRVALLRNIVLTLVVSTLLPACSGSGEGESPARGTATTAPNAVATRPATAQAPPSAERLPNGPWTDLARRLVESADLQTAVNLTREVLARGGVGTFDGDRVLVNVTSPAAVFQLSPLETVHMAMEARRRLTASRLTVAELAQMLEGFGWPFPGARPDGGNAAGVPRGLVTPADEETMREAAAADRKSARDAAGSADDGMQEAVEKERQAGRAQVDAAQQRVQQATDAWQKARQAAARAPAAERAAADARVKEALDARMAAIQELGRVRKAEGDAERERRTRASRARDEAYRIERMQSHIGSDYDNGERLMEMLAAWVRNAAARPEDPRSFTPLFLAEMARLQDPPVDLLASPFTRTPRAAGAPVDLRGGPRSGRLRLTLLEVQLMAAAFLRPPAGSAALDAPRPRAPDVMRARYVPALQSGPCSDLTKSIEELGKRVAGDLGGAAAGGVAGAAAGDALDKAIESAVGEAAAESFGKVMDAFGLLARIAKLVAFYGDTQVSVTPEPRSIHKPTGSNELVAYVATAGVSDRDLEEYKRAVENLSKEDRATRDCLEAAGMPRLANLSDLAKEAEEWLVEWRLVEGSPPHAYFSLRTNDFYLPGRQAMKLRRAGANSASATFVVDILPEERHSGRVVRAYVTARASVDAAGMPSIGTILNPITGALGLVESLVELAAGWFQYMHQPKAYGTIEVEYHCPRPTVFHETGKPIGDGGGGDGPSDCVIAAERGK